jgi:hypothetical protein
MQHKTMSPTNPDCAIVTNNEAADIAEEQNASPVLTSWMQRTLSFDVPHPSVRCVTVQ